MSKVIHFEIPVSNPKKTINFYEYIFDWTISQFGDQEYWLVSTGKESEYGIHGALTRKIDNAESVKDIDTPNRAINAVITVNVEDLDRVIQKIEEAGGTVVTEKTTVPGVGTYVYFQDLDGNLIGAMKSVENSSD